MVYGMYVLCVKMCLSFVLLNRCLGLFGFIIKFFLILLKVIMGDVMMVLDFLSFLKNVDRN